MANVIVRKIGTGELYKDVMEWYGSLRVGNSGNLVARDVVEVGQLTPGAHTNNAWHLLPSGFNTDEQHYLAIRATPGYEFDGRLTSSGPTTVQLDGGIHSYVPFTRLESLYFYSSTFKSLNDSTFNNIVTSGLHNISSGTIDGCGFGLYDIRFSFTITNDASNLTILANLAAMDAVVRNCVFTGTNISYDLGSEYGRGGPVTLATVVYNSTSKLRNNTVYKSILDPTGYEFAQPATQNFWIRSYGYYELPISRSWTDITGGTAAPTTFCPLVNNYVADSLVGNVAFMVWTASGYYVGSSGIYNAGFDNSLPTATNFSYTPVGLSANDGRISRTWPLVGSGQDLSSEFIWDMTGQIRNAPWTIGADQPGSGLDSLRPDGITLLASGGPWPEGTVPLYTFQSVSGVGSTYLYTKGVARHSGENLGSTIYRTIGAGGDYVDPNDWWTSIRNAGSGDLVARGVVEVGILLADNQFNDASVYMNNYAGLRTDSSHYFSLRNDSNCTKQGTGLTSLGYHIGRSTNFVNDCVIRCEVPYTKLDDFYILMMADSQPTSGTYYGIQMVSGLVDGVRVDQPTFQDTSSAGHPLTASSGRLELVGFDVQYSTIQNSVCNGADVEYLLGTTPYAKFDHSRYDFDGFRFDANSNLYNNTFIGSTLKQADSGINISFRGNGFAEAFYPPRTSGCFLWFDASDGLSLSATPTGLQYLPSTSTNVASWKDKSGLGNHAIANSPTTSRWPKWEYRKGPNNFHGISSKVDTNQHLVLPYTSGKLQHGYTIFAVAKFADTTPSVIDAYIAGAQYDSNNRGYLAWFGVDGNTGYISIGARTGSSNAQGRFRPYIFGPQSLEIYSAVVDPSSVNNNIMTYINGSPRGSSDFSGQFKSDWDHLRVEAGNNQMETLYLGGVNNNIYQLYSTNLSGSLHEFIMYNRPLTDRERRLIELGLAKKWNLVDSGSPLIGGSLINNYANTVSSGGTINTLDPKGAGFNTYSSAKMFNATYDTSLTGVRDLTSLPVQVNSPLPNLLTGSQLVGSGFNLSSQFTWDYYNGTRATTWDIGAVIGTSGYVSNMTLYTSGPIPGTGTVPLYTIGPLSPSSGISLYVTTIDTNPTIPLIVWNPPPQATMPLFLKALPLPSGTVRLITTGGYDNSSLASGSLNSNTKLVIPSVGVSGDSSYLNLFLKGATSDTPAIGMNLVLGSPWWDLYYNKNSNMKLYLNGFPINPVHFNAIGANEKVMPLYMRGISGFASGNMNTYIRGGGTGYESGMFGLFVRNSGIDSQLTLVVNPRLTLGTTLYVSGEAWHPTNNNMTLAISGRYASSARMNLYMNQSAHLSNVIPIYTNSQGNSESVEFVIFANNYNPDPNHVGLDGYTSAYAAMNLFINRQSEAVAKSTNLVLRSIDGMPSGSIPMIISAITARPSGSTTLVMPKSNSSATNINPLFTYGF